MTFKEFFSCEIFNSQSKVRVVSTSGVYEGLCSSGSDLDKEWSLNVDVANNTYISLTESDIISVEVIN